jgi:hypothetical protein
LETVSSFSAVATNLLDAVRFGCLEADQMENKPPTLLRTFVCPPFQGMKSRHLTICNTPKDGAGSMCKDNWVYNLGKVTFFIFVDHTFNKPPFQRIALFIGLPYWMSK